MSILGKIFSKIFPKAHADAPQPAPAPAPAAPKPSAPSATAAPKPAAPAPAAPTPAAPKPISEVDVEAILNELSRKNPEKLNWRASIVDLLKLLDLDSSLAARKELAQELNYSGDTSDSATMNIWLHKQVMKKLAENGGKVPADLKD